MGSKFYYMQKMNSGLHDKIIKELFFLLAFLPGYLFCLGQDTVVKVKLGAPTIPFTAAKTEIITAEKLQIVPVNLKNLDSLSLAVLTPLKPRPVEEKMLFKKFRDFKDTAVLIYDTTGNL